MNDCLPDRAAKAREAFAATFPSPSARRDHMRRLAAKSAIVRRQRRLAALDRKFRDELAEFRATCEHTWPDEIVAASPCGYCDLPYGEWSA